MASAFSTVWFEPLPHRTNYRLATLPTPEAVSPLAAPWGLFLGGVPINIKAVLERNGKIITPNLKDEIR